MWQRKTFHECAAELSGISQQFRAAYVSGSDSIDRRSILRKCSIDGVDILKILALSIRSYQDYGSSPLPPNQIGAMNENVSPADIAAFIRDYRPPYAGLSGFSSLGLREVLNKIAHANPGNAGFYADQDHHDLILSGTKRANHWIAVFSLIDLCKAVEALPDVETEDALSQRPRSRGQTFVRR